MPSAGVFLQHPQTQTAVEGSVTDFNCTVKACSDCKVIWRIQRFEIGAEVYRSHSAIPKYVGHGLMLSTLHLVAVRSSGVQCERYNLHKGKSHFSKFAFLHVITSQGMCVVREVNNKYLKGYFSPQTLSWDQGNRSQLQILTNMNTVQPLTIIIIPFHIIMYNHLLLW